MKGRRPVNRANREVLLLYHFQDTEIGRQVHHVAARMGILCRVVEENQTGQTLGALLKLSGFAWKEENQEDQEAKTSRERVPMQRRMMVLYGFTSRRLDEFLSNMKRMGIPRIALKAIVTPQNIGWTLEALYQELEKEDERMGKAARSPEPDQGKSEKK